MIEQDVQRMTDAFITWGAAIENETRPVFRRLHHQLRRARLISCLPPGHGQRYHTNRTRTRR